MIGLGLQKVIEKIESFPYTQLASWHLSEKTSSGLVAPTVDSPLTQIVPTDQPDHVMFHAGDLLIFNGIKAGNNVPTRLFTVQPTSKVKDLTHFIEKGFDLVLVKPTSKIPMPGRDIADGSKTAVIRASRRDRKRRARRSPTTTSVSLDKTHHSLMGFKDEGKGEVEKLFKRLDLIAFALGAVGILILIAGFYTAFSNRIPRKGITTMDSMAMGAIQGLSLPFRGFSRSGATISLGLLRGIARTRAEEFSFALAVVLTPALVVYESYRLFKHMKETSPLGFQPSDLSSRRRRNVLQLYRRAYRV